MENDIHAQAESKGFSIQQPVSFQWKMDIGEEMKRGSLLESDRREKEKKWRHEGGFLMICGEM